MGGKAGILAVVGLLMAMSPAVRADGPDSGSAGQPPAGAQSLSVLLEKGIYTEETVGDLDAAIKIYGQIVAQAKVNRILAAQAQFRLGVCQMKKGRSLDAISSFRQVISDYPEQKVLVAQAEKKMAEARGGMGEAEIAKIVGEAVTGVSTMAEGDPRISKLLRSLRELKESSVVKDLAAYFDSDKDTVRRAAIYLLWKGEFSDAGPAAPGLVKLCSHKEDLTRGTAALALGGLKVESSFSTLAEMLANDKSGYARRCAACALGLLGDPKAKPLLEKALKDPDQFVRNNAEAALTLLAQGEATGPARLPPDVMSYVIGQHFQAMTEAKKKGLRVNTQIYGVDDRFNMYFGGLLVYHNDTDYPLRGPVHLGSFGPERKDYILIGEDGREQAYEYHKNPDPDASRGKWAMVWRPDKPVEPGATRLFGYLDRKVRPLPERDGAATLAMANTFGAPVLENFFLVVPPNVVPAEGSPAPKSKTAIGQFVIYLWQDQVPANAEHKVTVELTKTAPADAPGLNLLPAPWPDGEVLNLTLYVKTGAEVGAIQWRADLIDGPKAATTQPADAKVWRITSRTVVPVSNMTQFTRVDATRDSFTPIAALTANSLMGRFEAAYSTAKVQLDATADGKTSTRSFGLAGPVYDNEQVLYLIRRLPLKEGYSATFSIFPVLSGTQVKCTVEVVGREDVPGPGGEKTACHKVSLKVLASGETTLHHHLWFSDDQARVLVKYEAPEFDMKLTGRTTRRQLEQAAAQGKNLVAVSDDFALRQPVDWMFYKSPLAEGDGRQTMYLLGPGLKAWAALPCRMARADAGTPRQVAEADIKVMEGFFKNFRVRPESWSDVKLAGLDGVSFLADYEDKGQSFVEYRTYLLDKSSVYWFVFRVRKTQFDSIRRDLDSLMAGLVRNNTVEN